MKYIIYPILKLIGILLLILIYTFSQFFYILWNLKPDKHLLEEIVNNKFYCKSRRSSFDTRWFEHNKTFRLSVVPKSLFQLILWEIKYSKTCEIPEITEKEKELYEEFCEHNKLQS